MVQNKIFFLADHPTVSYSLRFGQLWTPVLITTHGRKELVGRSTCSRRGHTCEEHGLDFRGGKRRGHKVWPAGNGEGEDPEGVGRRANTITIHYTKVSKNTEDPQLKIIGNLGIDFS